jgi:hypothetical protein
MTGVSSGAPSPSSRSNGPIGSVAVASPTLRLDPSFAWKNIRYGRAMVGTYTTVGFDTLRPSHSANARASRTGLAALSSTVEYPPVQPSSFTTPMAWRSTMLWARK